MPSSSEGVECVVHFLLGFLANPTTRYLVNALQGEANTSDKQKF